MSDKKKKEYVKPEVAKREIKIKEVVMAGCKDAAVSGTSGPGTQKKCQKGHKLCFEITS
jgi:hypothetical protein